MIALIDASFDLGGRALGARLGPDSLYLAGLKEELERCGEEVSISPAFWRSDPQEPTDQAGIRERALEFYPQLRDSVASAMKRGDCPVVLGGDHSLSIGSLAGALSEADDLAILWLDAHADINTISSSPSGNLHGMPMAAALGLPDEDAVWQQILSEVMLDRTIPPGRCAWLGLRDVDAGESRNLADLDGALIYTMQDVDKIGVPAAMDRIAEWLEASGAKRLWVSFDVDALDPVLTPGTGTAVRGGFTYRESHLIAECLYEMPCELAGMDIVEVNPLLGERNTTAQAAVEWTASLFGKTILGRGERR